MGPEREMICVHVNEEIAAGFDVGRRIMGVEAMQASQNAALRPHLTAAIRTILEG